MDNYTVILNSNNRANPTDSANNAIYNFDWGVLDESKYKLTWNLVKTTLSLSYNTISSTNLIWYYNFDTVNGVNVYNKATGTAVQDATINNYTTVANNRMTTVSPATQPSGITINNVVPCSTSAGISFSYWIKPSTLSSTYSFITELQDTLGYSGGGNRFYITIDPTNRMSVNNNVNSAVLAVNTVYHFAITITSAGAVNMYLNNALVASGTTAYPSYINASGNNFICNDKNGTGFMGWIQEYRLYCRIITVGEINTLFTAGYNI